MYRLKFDPKLGAWLIQIQSYGFLWTSLRKGAAPETFPNYDAAADKVVALGLDRAYRNAADTPSVDIWRGQHPGPTWQASFPEPAVVRRRAA